MDSEALLELQKICEEGREKYIRPCAEDISVALPSREEIQELLGKLRVSSREEINEQLSRIAKHNLLNPQGKRFSGISQARIDARLQEWAQTEYLKRQQAREAELMGGETVPSPAR